MKILKILHVTSELDGGGIERMLYNYSLYMPSNIKFDFAICSEHKGILEEKFVQNGSKIYRYPRIKKGFFKTIRRLKLIIQKGNYDIVQVHADYRSFVALFAALVCGVKIRIAHSHTFNEPESFFKYMVRIIITPITKLFATHLFACGEDAGRWTWGNKNVERGKVFFMRNAIESEPFAFDNNLRILIRQALGVKDKTVIGNVGRLCYQKNQFFLLKVMKEIVKQDDNTILLLIGGGEDEKKLKEYVEKNKLSTNVIFLGVRKDVNELLSALDLFVLPSKYEGLPVTLVEIQANGLPAVVADTVTKEVKFNDNMKYLELNKNVWASNILHFQNKRLNIGLTELESSGYEIKNETKRISKYYRLLFIRSK